MGLVGVLSSLLPTAPPAPPDGGGSGVNVQISLKDGSTRTVQFDKTPTPQDVDFVAAQLESQGQTSATPRPGLQGVAQAAQGVAGTVQSAGGMSNPGSPFAGAKASGQGYDKFGNPVYSGSPIASQTLKTLDSETPAPKSNSVLQLAGPNAQPAGRTANTLNEAMGYLDSMFGGNTHYQNQRESIRQTVQQLATQTNPDSGQASGYGADVALQAARKFSLQEPLPAKRADAQAMAAQDATDPSLDPVHQFTVGAAQGLQNEIQPSHDLIKKFITSSPGGAALNAVNPHLTDTVTGFINPVEYASFIKSAATNPVETLNGLVNQIAAAVPNDPLLARIVGPMLPQGMKTGSGAFLYDTNDEGKPLTWQDRQDGIVALGMTALAALHGIGSAREIVAGVAPKVLDWARQPGVEDSLSPQAKAALPLIAHFIPAEDQNYAYSQPPKLLDLAGGTPDEAAAQNARAGRFGTSQSEGRKVFQNATGDAPQGLRGPREAGAPADAGVNKPGVMNEEPPTALTGPETGTKPQQSVNLEQEAGPVGHPEQSSPAAKVPGETPALPEAAAPSASAPVRTRAVVLQELADLDAEQAARSKGMGSKQTGAVNISAEDFAYMAKRGVLLVESGVRGFTEWTAAMLDHFGSAIKPLLPDLYKQAHLSSSDTVSRLSRGIDAAENLTREDQQNAIDAQRSAQAGRISSAQVPGGGEGTLGASMKAASGEFDKPTFKPLRDSFSQGEIDDLHNRVLDREDLRPFEKLNAQNALDKVMNGELPQPAQMKLLGKVFGPDVVDALLSKRGTGEKIADALLAIRRFDVLSGPGILGKLGMTGAQGAVTTPLEDLVGRGIGAVKPGLAKLAPWETNASFANSWKGLKEVFSKGSLKDSFDMLKTGENSLDKKYGAGSYNGSGFWNGLGGLFMRVHGSLMTPLQRGAFVRSLGNRMDAFARTPGTAALGAYHDSLQMVFRNDNKFTEAFQDGMRAASQKIGRGTTVGIKAIGAPIVSVPSNVAGRFAEYSGVPGLFNLKYLVTDAAKGLAPEDAAAVMRSFKRGGVGAGLMALGFFKPGYVDKLPGAVKHNPAVQAYLVGSTLRQSFDSGKGPGEAALKIGKQTLADLPMAREAWDLLSIPMSRTPEEAGKLLGEEAGGWVPASGLLGYVARTLDKPGGASLTGDTNPRSAHGFGQGFDEGLPGLRSSLPAPKKK